MLRISKLADYGTVIMVYLTRRAPCLSNVRDIAHITHLNLPTVSKLVKRLTAAGLLLSVRGVHGGYRLSRAPAEISVAEIIYALEPQRGLVECSLEPNACSLQGMCHVQGNWQLLSQALSHALESVTLAALAKPLIPMKDIERIRQSGVSFDKKQ